MPDINFWTKELELADTQEEGFRKKADSIYKRYRDDRGEAEVDEFRFNILWANTETQRPALLSSTPIPDVRRRITNRFDQPEDISRFGALMIERSLEFMLDPGSGKSFETFGQKVVSDFLLPGRAVAKVDYVPTLIRTKRRVELTQSDGEFMDGKGARVPPEQAIRDDNGVFFEMREEEDLAFEEVGFTRVSHHMFRRDPSASCWEDTDWVAFGQLMTKVQIDNKPEFNAKLEDIPLNFDANKKQIKRDDQKKVTGKFALVWQIWSKPDRKVYTVVPGMKVFLDSGKEVGGKPDPLNLMNFFPCPEPAYILPDPETLIPTSEFNQYQDQAREIDRMTHRIANLITILKAVGVYAGETKDIVSQIRDAKDGELIPVAEWRLMAEKGGLSGIIDWLPIENIVRVVQTLIAERTDLIRQVFELTGISDIQRGSTDPRETKGSQVIKANFATRRLLIKQQTIQRFFRDLYRMAGELIVEKFSPQFIAAMTTLPLQSTQAQQGPNGQPIPAKLGIDQVLPVMRQDRLRSLRVDIETDSTVAPDDARDKEGVAEFISALSRMFSSLAPLLQASPGAAPAVGAIILEAAKRFRFSREVEDQLRQVIQSGSQQQQDPEAQQEAQEMLAKMVEMQQEMQQKQVEFIEGLKEQQRESQRKDAETNAKIAAIAAKIERDDELAKVKESAARLKAAQ